MTPEQLLADHEARPRHLGRLAAADGTGTIGSILAGSALRLFVRLDGERIVETRFQVFACNDQVAAASVFAEMITGRTVAAALALGGDDICAHLGGLERARLPLLVWAPLALAEALRGPCGTAVPPWTEDPIGPDLPLLCRCLGLSRATVARAASENAEIGAVIAHTGASSVCGSCRSDIEALLGADQEPLAPEPAGGLGRVGLMRAIIQALEPIMSQAQDLGLALEPWDLTDTRVVLRLVGASDEATRDRLQDRAERRLKDEVDPLLRVEMAVAPA